jgi:hypothetical protein
MRAGGFTRLFEAAVVERRPPGDWSIRRLITGAVHALLLLPTNRITPPRRPPRQSNVSGGQLRGNELFQPSGPANRLALLLSLQNPCDLGGSPTVPATCRWDAALAQRSCDCTKRVGATLL